MSQNLDVSPPAGGHVMRAAVELLGFISLTAAVLGVFGVFWGWRISSAYFYSFGLTSEWIPFQPVQLVMLAWVEMILILVLISYCVIVQVVIQRVDIHTNHRTVRAVLLVVSLICIASVTLMIVFFAQNTSTVSLSLFFVVGGLGFCSWWLVIVLGSELFGDNADPTTGLPIKLDSAVRALFSAKTALVLIAVGLAIIYVSGFASKHGRLIGMRDKAPDSRLPQISIMTTNMLQIPNGQRITGAAQGQDGYLYSDLRLITQSSEFLFVFRLTESDLTTGAVVCHIVPLKTVSSLQIKEWQFPQTTSPPP